MRGDLLTHTRENKLIQLSSGHWVIPKHKREANTYGPYLFLSCLLSPTPPSLNLSCFHPPSSIPPPPLLFFSLCSLLISFSFLPSPIPLLHSLPPSTPTSLPPSFLPSSHLVIWQSSLRTSLCSMGLPLRRLNSTSSWIKFCCTSGCLVCGVSERALRRVMQCSVAAEEHPKHLP